MAYMAQDRKKAIAEKLKVALKDSGLKYTLGVHHHSTLVMKIQSGPVDFIKNYNDTVKATTRFGQHPGSFQEATTYLDINDYWYKEHFTGKALELLQVIIPILNDGNHDNSDIQTDYFDVGWYLSVKVGTWEKPYQLAA